MPDTQVIEQAQFTVQPSGTPLVVHFNPLSLQYTVENTLDEEGSGTSKKQFVSKSTGKLTMELIFDTTHIGADVRATTEQIAQFMQPGAEKVPPVVLFEWGTYTFQGMVDSFKETLDFFAPGGIPLRSSVSLSMSQQDQVFAPGNHAPPVDTQGEPDAFDFPSAPAGEDSTSLATKAGDARGGRAIAAANGLDSMRFPGGSLTVSGGVSLSPPAAFASGGGGGGFSAGVGGGASAGFSGSTSAGIAASSGAFAGLRTSTTAAASLNAARLSASVQTNVPNPANGSVQVGGKAITTASSGLKTDVGANVDLTARLQFDAR